MAAVKTLELLNFDAAYLLALHKGDPEIERHFFTYFTPLIYRKVRKYLRSHDLIQEGAQETLARVVMTVRSRSGVRHPERFGAFVHAVCRNVAMEIIRREKRFVALEEAEQRKPSRFESPHSVAEARETRERVGKILASLPEFDRQLLEAVFLAEEDRSVLCRRFGVSDGYLRVLLHRAKQHFLEHMSRKTPKAFAAAASSSGPGTNNQSQRASAITELPLAYPL
jgi:RNA polymerase sigma-70 factor, ECF subfamily